MKILVIGTGSIGTRHINNLLKLGVRPVLYSCSGLRKFKELDYIDSLIVQEFDGIIICSKTSQHEEHIAFALQCSRNIFIEKPLLMKLDEFASWGGLVNPEHYIETGFMLRLHPQVKQIKEIIESDNLGRLLHCKLNVGQHLKFWRPNVDYVDSYSAKATEGGGVLNDLSHELDLARFFCGTYRSFSAQILSGSVINIDSEASADVISIHNNGIQSNVHLDYLNLAYTRDSQFIFEKGSVFWNYATAKLQVFDNEGAVTLSQSMSNFDRNDMYEDYVQHFLNNIKNGGKNTVSDLEDGLEIVKLINVIKKENVDEGLRNRG